MGIGGSALVGAARAAAQALGQSLERDAGLQADLAARFELLQQVGHLGLKVDGGADHDVAAAAEGLVVDLQRMRRAARAGGGRRRSARSWSRRGRRPRRRPLPVPRRPAARPLAIDLQWHRTPASSGTPPPCWRSGGERAPAEATELGKPAHGHLLVAMVQERRRRRARKMFQAARAFDPYFVILHKI